MKFGISPPKTDCCCCRVGPGELHVSGCDIEQCPDCGGQVISCGCHAHLPKDDDRIPWGGEYPGTAECREHGLWAKPTPAGWKRCGKGDPGAIEDLNSLRMFGRWDKGKRKFVLKTMKG